METQTPGRPIAMIVLDGAGDALSPARGGTPFERAALPALDHLAANGYAGMLTPIAGGVTPETHSGLVNLLGYQLSPAEIPRGPIEALGCGLRIDDGDLALRVNFGTRDAETGLIADRRVCRSLSITEAEELSDAVQSKLTSALPDYQIALRVVREYRLCAVVCAPGRRFSDAVSNTDPAYPTEGAGIARLGPWMPLACRALDGSSAAQDTAQIVNSIIEVAEAVLETHPINAERSGRGEPAANCWLTRGPGAHLPRVTPLPKLMGGPVTMLVDLPIEAGVGHLVGADVRTYTIGTGRNPYGRLLDAIQGASEASALVVVHVKGPDEFGHDRDFVGKARCLESLDRELIQPLVDAELGATLVVTSDHATPCSSGFHSADPVPFVIFGERVPHRPAAAFTERACSLAAAQPIVGSALLSQASLRS